MVRSEIADGTVFAPGGDQMISSRSGSRLARLSTTEPHSILRLRDGDPHYNTYERLGLFNRFVPLRITTRRYHASASQAGLLSGSQLPCRAHDWKSTSCKMFLESADCKEGIL